MSHAFSRPLLASLPNPDDAVVQFRNTYIKHDIRILQSCDEARRQRLAGLAMQVLAGDDATAQTYRNSVTQDDFYTYSTSIKAAPMDILMQRTSAYNAPSDRVVAIANSGLMQGAIDIGKTRRAGRARIGAGAVMASIEGRLSSAKTGKHGHRSKHPAIAQHERSLSQVRRSSDPDQTFESAHARRRSTSQKSRSASVDSAASTQGRRGSSQTPHPLAKKDAEKISDLRCYGPQDARQTVYMRDNGVQQPEWLRVMDRIKKGDLQRWARAQLEGQTGKSFIGPAKVEGYDEIQYFAFYERVRAPPRSNTIEFNQVKIRKA